ncbi:MAG: sulfatase family protein [Gemmata sp.]
MKVPSALFALLVAALPARAADKPNIVVILADDLGYGDVRCLNPDGKIATPHLDALAAAGMTFTDAHSPSAVCSPTRYGLVTGRYAWRSKLKSGVLGGLSPRLIEPGRLTAAQLLKDNGYHTACVGKWHLGMDWELKPNKKVSELNIEPREQVFNVEYDKPIKNGPNAVGFDYYFGISASLDMVPYTFIENDKVVANPTEDRDLVMFAGKPGRTRKGPAAPGFEAEGVLRTLRDKAAAYIAGRAKEKSPFFLYLPLTTPHTPVAPSKEWDGKSKLNAYADFVMQTDAAVGDVLAALKKHGLEDNTLVVFTSDNGCSPQADFPALAKLGHNPNHVFRGSKADVYEGGHRVPFFVRWPGKVKPGSTSKALACHTDLFATCADAIGAKVPDTAAEDSVSLLPALGVREGKVREGVVVHSINGSFGVREGDWKLCLCAGSGGWSAPRPGKDEAGLPATQLFDLAKDIGEKTNVADKHPEVVARLTRQLEKWVADGRSSPGAPQKNTTPVEVRKR